MSGDYVACPYWSPHAGGLDRCELCRDPLSDAAVPTRCLGIPSGGHCLNRPGREAAMYQAARSEWLAERAAAEVRRINLVRCGR